MQELISRAFSFQTSEEGNIIGVPIVFNQRTNIGNWFTETIVPEAISESVLRDVAFFVNHDLNTKPLARTRNGRLKLEIKSDGVHMEANVNRDRSDANDLYLAIQDGDIDGMSFMFRVEEDRWEDLESDMPHRTITKIGYVQEVSAVTYPAYEGTSISARGSENLDRLALDNARSHASELLDNDSEKREKAELELLKEKYKYL